MTFKQALRKVFGVRDLDSRDSRRGKSWQPRFRFAPRLEWLENRLAPAILTVSSLADSGVGTLRAAILNSINHQNGGTGNDTILFSAAIDGGTIKVTTFQNNGSVGPSAFVNTAGNTLTIDGETGLTRGITISRNSTVPFRLFYNSTGSLTLKGLTLSNGLAKGGNGGGDDGAGGGGGAGMGGAIYNHGTLTILDSTLTGNTAQGGNGMKGGKINGGGGGGGMGGDGYTGKSVDNPFPTGDGAFGLGGDGGGPNRGIGGTAPGKVGGAGAFGGGGGGGYGFGGFITSYIPFSTRGGAGGFGGGGGGGGSGNVGINGSPGGIGGFGGGGGGGGNSQYGGAEGGFGGGIGIGNSGGGGAGMGGAIFSRIGTVIITNSTLSGNSAIGGVSGTPGTSGNGAALGGAVFAYNCAIQITSDTISLNTAGTGGRGIYVLGLGLGTATASINNTIIGQNDTNGSDLRIDVTSGGHAAVSGGTNLIRTISTMATTAVTNTLTNTLTADPKLGLLQNNGGGTPTMALLGGSPAIAAGTFSLAPSADERGAFRDPVGTKLVDIGAYEAPPIANFVVNSASDNNVSDNLLTLREAIALASGSIVRPLSVGERAQVIPAAGSVGTITFADSLKGQTLTLSTVGDRSVGPSAFVVNSPVVIVGPSGNSGITLSAAGTTMRLFDVGSAGSLTLQNLTLSGGSAQGLVGGASTLGGAGGASAGLGGAIFNQGTLTILNSTLTGNIAQGGAGGNFRNGSPALGGAGGAGLAAVGGDSSTNNGAAGGGPNGGAGGPAGGGTGGFGGGGGGGAGNGNPNQPPGGAGGFGGGGGGGGYFGSMGGAGGFGGGGGGAGGVGGPAGAGGYGGGAGGAVGVNAGGGGGAPAWAAVFNEAGAVLITNSTFTGNTAAGGAGGIAQGQKSGTAGQGLGGGLFNHNGVITVTNSTFSLNTAAQGGRGIVNLGDGATAAAVINNTIIGQADTNVTDLRNIMTNGGSATVAGASNLIRNPPNPSSLTGTLTIDPQLGPLQNNGGPTKTMALPAGSPAIDAATTAGAVTDQRGLFRTGKVDIGAFEAVAPGVQQVQQVATDPQLQGLIKAINALSPQSPAVTVQVNLAAGTYGDIVLLPPAGVKVILTGAKNTTVVGHSPALTVSGGQVEVDELTLTTDTDSPTVMVTGGTLTLRGDTIEETPGFDDPAIHVTGGMLDLGTADDPGNNVVQGQGNFLDADDADDLTTVGDTFEINGVMQTGTEPTTTTVTIVAGANAQGAGAVLTASVMPWSGGMPTGDVDFFDVTANADLGQAPLNLVQGIAQAALTTVNLSAGVHQIRATYLGDGTFLPSAVVVDQIVTAAAGGDDNNQDFINALYLYLLDRQPDADGLAFWAGALATGVTRQQISTDILNSDEGRIEQIEQLYQTELGRSGDDAGVQANLQYLKGGGTLEGLQTIFFSSPEFVARSGGTVELYVDELYRFILGRSSTGDEGANSFVKLIQDGGDRASVVTDLLMSPEGNRELASQLYATILGRGASADELSFWTTALQQSGHPEEMAIASFLGSDEFFSRS